MNMEFYRHARMTARKPHTCEYCNESIAAGQKYSRETGKWDGEFFVRKLCLTCDMILREFSSELYDDEGFNWGNVTDFLVENYCAECRCHQKCNEMPARCKNIREKFPQPEEMK